MNHRRSEVLDIPSGQGDQQASCQPQRKPCKHYQAGHCRRGKKCNFHHNTQNCESFGVVQAKGVLHQHKKYF